MVCRKFKIYILSFSCTCSYETISHMNEVKAESHLHDIVNICLEFQSCIRNHYKVTGLQSLENYTILDFYPRQALSCVTKLILTEKLVGVGNSNFGFVHFDNRARH